MSVKGPAMMTNGWRFNQTHRWLNEHEGRQWKINALYARAESLLTVISCLCASGEQRPLMETPPSALTTYSMYIIMEGFYRVRETHYAEAQRKKQYLSIY